MRSCLVCIAASLSLASPTLGEGDSARFEVAYSEKLDAATFLNAISDEPRFNGPWKAVRETWRPKIEADPEAAPAFSRWLGRGIQLAYLLSILPEEDLDGVINRLEAPDDALAAIEAGIDEPAYLRVFEDLEKDVEGVRTILTFLKREGFAEVRSKKLDALPLLARVWLDDLRDRRYAAQLASWIETFTGRSIPDRCMRIYVLVFAQPLSFQLAGFAVGWSSDPTNANGILVHEFLHKFNPSAANVELMEHLAKEDDFYRDAFDRIYGEFHEGREEEFVEAAARHVIERMWPCRVRNLRSMKFEFFSEKTRVGGVPLAAILYEELGKAQVGPGRFDYNTFLGRALGDLKPGTIEERYLQVLRPVAGTAGMVIRENGSIERVFEGFPAADAGLRAGDMLLQVNAVDVAGWSREEVLDRLAGEPGKQIDLLVRRGNDEVRVSFKLR